MVHTSHSRLLKSMDCGVFNPNGKQKKHRGAARCFTYRDRLASGLDDAFADGVLYQFGAGVHAKLTHDVFTVPGDGLGADAQSLANL